MRCATKAGVWLPIPLKRTTVRIMEVVTGVTHPVDTVITSANDGVHMKGSRHYSGDALDFRTKHWPKANDFIERIKFQLGNRYDVIHESVGRPNQHLHIEYDPKT